jgi:hypothetical protein
MDAFIHTRSLLGDCSGSDKLMGAAPMWLSVIIILLMGFVAGVLTGVFATQYRQRKWMQRSIPGHETQVYDANQAVPTGWVPAVLRHKRTVSSQLAEGRTAGPLSAAWQDSNGQGQAVVNPSLRASSNMNGSSHPSFAPMTDHLNAREHPQSVSEVSIDNILGKQTSLGKQGSGIEAYAAETGIQDTEESHSHPLAHQAVSSIAQSVPNLSKKEQRAKDAEAVQGSYDLDDLDDEWKELLGQIDAAFLTMNKETMDSQERAVAIRTLLVSTAREEPEAALTHAIQDVERFRRIHRK